METLFLAVLQVMVAGSNRSDIASARTALFAGSPESTAILANDGDVAAQILLAEADLTGRCAARDSAIAAGWLCKAAELDGPSAQVFLAQFYKQGAGVEKDMVESAQRPEEAAV